MQHTTQPRACMTIPFRFLLSSLLLQQFAGAPPVELVACCGYGKNGALCALQRGVRPQVVTSFGLPGHSNLFTLLAAPTEVGQMVT